MSGTSTTSSSCTSSQTNSPLTTARTTPKRHPKPGAGAKGDDIQIEMNDDDTELVVTKKFSRGCTSSFDDTSKASGSSVIRRELHTKSDGATIADNQSHKERQNEFTIVTAIRSLTSSPAKTYSSSSSSPSKFSLKQYSSKKVRSSFECVNNSPSRTLRATTDHPFSQNSNSLEENSPSPTRRQRPSDKDECGNRSSCNASQLGSNCVSQSKEYSGGRCSTNHSTSRESEESGDSGGRRREESAGSTVIAVELNDINQPGRFGCLRRRNSSTSNYTDDDSIDQIELEITG